MKLKLDDEVTVVARNDTLFTVVKRVQSLHSSGFIADIDATQMNRIGYQYAHEGVHWIHGAHLPGSREVKALLAAHALVAE